MKDYEFYKILDLFVAFQELSMFISGIMGGKSPKMIEIADKDRRDMKGFNDKSFRNMKRD